MRFNNLDETDEKILQCLTQDSRMSHAELGRLVGLTRAAVRERVLAARARQSARSGQPNARLDQAQTNAFCRLAPRDTALLERAVEALQLSARSLHRILRVARTIADLAGSEAIDTPHLTEAIGYRTLERGRERAAA